MSIALGGAVGSRGDVVAAMIAPVVHGRGALVDVAVVRVLLAVGSSLLEVSVVVEVDVLEFLDGVVVVGLVSCCPER